MKKDRIRDIILEELDGLLLEQLQIVGAEDDTANGSDTINVDFNPAETASERNRLPDPHGINKLVNDISAYTGTVLRWNPTKADNASAIESVLVDFKDRLAQLEGIVDDLSRGQIPLERIPEFEDD